MQPLHIICRQRKPYPGFSNPSYKSPTYLTPALRHASPNVIRLPFAQVICKYWCTFPGLLAPMPQPLSFLLHAFGSQSVSYFSSKPEQTAQNCSHRLWHDMRYKMWWHQYLYEYIWPLWLVQWKHGKILPERKIFPLWVLVHFLRIC